MSPLNSSTGSVDGCRVSARIAEGVVRTARDQGVGRVIDDAQIPGAVAAAMWDPDYVPMRPAIGARALPSEAGA